MRIAKRKERRARVGFSHRVTKDDTMAWFKQRFDGIILVGASLVVHVDLSLTDTLSRNKCLLHPRSLSRRAPLYTHGTI